MGVDEVTLRKHVSFTFVWSIFLGFGEGMYCSPTLPFFAFLSIEQFEEQRIEQWQMEWAEKAETRAVAHRKMLEAVLASPDNEPERALQKKLKVCMVQRKSGNEQTRNAADLWLTYDVVEG